MLADHRSAWTCKDTHLWRRRDNRNSASLDEAVHWRSTSGCHRPDDGGSYARVRGERIDVVSSTIGNMIGCRRGCRRWATAGPVIALAAVAYRLHITSYLSDEPLTRQPWTFVGAAFGLGRPTMFLSGEKLGIPSSELRSSGAPSSRQTARGRYIEPPEEVLAATQAPVTLFHCRCSRPELSPVTSSGSNADHRVCFRL